jgi:hypothetical protein
MTKFKCDLKKAATYFKAFAIAKNLKDGELWDSVNYMIWIDKKHRRFKTEKGYKDIYAPLQSGHEKLFEDWLFSEAELEAGKHAESKPKNEESKDTKSEGL